MKIFLVEGRYIGGDEGYNLNADYKIEKYIISENIQLAIKLFRIKHKEYEITDVELIDKRPIIQKELGEV